MTGKEKFEFDGKELDYDFIDFWKFHYSNIYDIQGRIAEFIVAKALDIQSVSIARKCVIGTFLFPAP